jgi:hypothetical protein
MGFRLFATRQFEESCEKVNSFEKARVEKAKKQIKINPFLGKPLGYKFFREKKIGGKRLYFLIYVKKAKILLIEYSGKKTQQVSIDKIRDSFDSFKKYIDELD